VNHRPDAQGALGADDDVGSRELSGRLRRRGIVVLALFGLLWATTGASALPGGAAFLARLLAVLVAVMVLGLGLPSGRPEVEQRRRRLPANWRRGVGVVGLVQFALIGLVAVGLVVAGWSAAVPALTCLVVGAHFLPLARLFDQPQYRWAGAALGGLAVAGLVLLGTVDAETSRLVVGFGAAAVLWVTALHLTRRG
jgi:hypothetical protein